MAVVGGIDRFVCEATVAGGGLGYGPPTPETIVLPSPTSLRSASPRSSRQATVEPSPNGLGCDAEELRHDFVPPRRSPRRRPPRFTPPNLPGAPLAAVAGNGRLRLRRSRRSRRGQRRRDGTLVPAGGHASPRGTHRAREPAHPRCARRLDGASHRARATGSSSTSPAALPSPARWSCSGTGGGLVVKRVEMLPRSEPPAASTDLRKPSVRALHMPRRRSPYRRIRSSAITNAFASSAFAPWGSAA